MPLAVPWKCSVHSQHLTAACMLLADFKFSELFWNDATANGFNFDVYYIIVLCAYSDSKNFFLKPSETSGKICSMILEKHFCANRIVSKRNCLLATILDFRYMTTFRSFIGKVDWSAHVLPALMPEPDMPVVLLCYSTFCWWCKGRRVFKMNKLIILNYDVVLGRLRYHRKIMKTWPYRTFTIYQSTITLCSTDCDEETTHCAHAW